MNSGGFRGRGLTELSEPDVAVRAWPVHSLGRSVGEALWGQWGKVALLQELPTDTL